MFIKAHGSKSRGQVGSSKQCPTDSRLAHVSILQEQKP